MRFSAAAGITRGTDDDWFDLVIDQDSPLYIDPYLVFEDDDPLWAGSYDDVVAFFELAAGLVLAAGGEQNTPAWRKAVELLSFPEPHEFALGVSMRSPRGSGTGPKFARTISEVLALLGTSRVPSLASIGGFALFCDGIGVDRISDILGNILKARFIRYTTEMNARHGVQLQPVPVKHASWNTARGRWVDTDLELFANGATGGGVLLVPERFLKDIPQVEPDQFWGWAENNQAALLRDDLNFDLSLTLTRSEKVAAARKVAWARPDAAVDYLEKLAADTHRPYDVALDPKGLVGWYEAGLDAAAAVGSTASTTNVPATEQGFNEWVVALAEDFQFVIENTDAWLALWDDAKEVHRKELIAQALAGVMWRQQCKAANVDLGKEVNVGRGPVDFKFSQGWQKRALLEVKYIESSHFTDGARKQLPQYLKSEEIDFGVYLAIGFTDRDFERPRVRLVEETCKAIAEKKGIEIRLVLVDARPRASASKL